MNNEGLVMKYFTLTPHKDDPYGHASRKALLAYADAIYGCNEQLATDLRSWVDSIDRIELKKETPNG